MNLELHRRDIFPLPQSCAVLLEGRKSDLGDVCAVASPESKECLHSWPGNHT